MYDDCDTVTDYVAVTFTLVLILIGLSFWTRWMIGAYIKLFGWE